MAETLERLTQRTRTMRSIRGIVSTMKTMSAINAAPYEQAARAIEAYQATVMTGFHAWLVRHGPLPVDMRSAGAAHVIAFGSDHGLCGNYNEIVADEVRAAIAAAPVAGVICIGAQMRDALEGLGIVPLTTLLPPATADGLGRLSGRLIGLLDGMRPAGAGSAAMAVSMVHMQRLAHGQQGPVTRPLLPLDPATFADLAQRPWRSRSLPQDRMAPDGLLAALIRSHLFAGLFRSAAEAMVTENAARLARMQQAEQSIDDQLDLLVSETRSARQTEITTELLDIVIGFEALTRRERRARGAAAGVTAAPSTPAPR